MRLLLDTNVLSELGRADGDGRVKAAIRAVDEDGLFVSVLTLGEVRQGIAKLPEGSRQALRLMAWLAELRDAYADRLLAIDAAVSEAWGAMNGRLMRIGRQVPAIDGLLAATALTHGLTVATRNVRDFTATGVDVLDPWNGERAES